MTEPLLRVRDLKTYFVTEHGSGTARAVDGVTFDVLPGETLGIVGESGCGKTVTSLSILRLIPEPPGHILPGSFIEFEGRNLLTLDPRELRAIRGNRIAMIFQEPMTSLNPVFTVGDQIAEAAIVHHQVSRRAARSRAIEMLRLVGIPDTEGLLASVPRLDAPPARARGRLRSIPGQVPAATAWPEGCRFHPRCPYAWDRCRAEEPPLLDAGGEPGTHAVRCWLLTDPRRRTPHP